MRSSEKGNIPQEIHRKMRKSVPLQRYGAAVAEDLVESMRLKKETVGRDEKAYARCDEWVKSEKCIYDQMRWQSSAREPYPGSRGGGHVLTPGLGSGFTRH